VDPWIAKTIILLGSCGLILIPHLQHRRGGGFAAVATSRKGPLEKALLILTAIAFLLTLVWVVTPALAAANYPLHPVPLTVGAIWLAVGLWVLRRSHADLGKNWSITLELRETHELVTRGIYRRVRHPMYSALLLYALGQTLVLPNWIAGPAYLIAVALLAVLRIGPEERMMREKFGDEYVAYMIRSRRLIPGVW